MLLLFWEIKDNIRQHAPKYIKIAANIGLWLSVNNLIDEIFFDPTQIQVNEYVLSLIIIIHTLWQATRKKKVFT